MHWLDPDCLPEISGAFERFLPNPHGDADGMILTDGAEVHFPPHMSAELCAAIQAGEKATVKVRGVRPRGGDLIVAVAIETADGRRIVDEGPRKDRNGEKKLDKRAAPPKRKPMHAEGIVRHVLHGPKGEARGALLEDGLIIRIPPHASERNAHLLSPGRKLAVRGEGLAVASGTVIEAWEIGASLDQVQPIEPKKPKDEHHRDHDEEAHRV